MTFLGRPGQGMGRYTRVSSEQEVSAFKDLVVTSEVRVGREEEGTSSLRPELAAIARTLQAIPLETDLLYLCDSEAALNRMSRWIGSGPRVLKSTCRKCPENQR